MTEHNVDDKKKRFPSITFLSLGWTLLPVKEYERNNKQEVIQYSYRKGM